MSPSSLPRCTTVELLVSLWQSLSLKGGTEFEIPSTELLCHCSNMFMRFQRLKIQGPLTSRAVRLDNWVPLEMVPSYSSRRIYNEVQRSSPAPVHHTHSRSAMCSDDTATGCWNLCLCYSLGLSLFYLHPCHGGPVLALLHALWSVLGTHFHNPAQFSGILRSVSVICWIPAFFHGHKIQWAVWIPSLDYRQVLGASNPSSCPSNLKLIKLHFLLNIWEQMLREIKTWVVRNWELHATARGIPI